MSAGRPRGLTGRTGAATGEEVLAGLRALRWSGTAAFADDDGAILLLISSGETLASYRLGRFGALDARDLRLHLESHERSDAPRIASAFPGASLPLLRALPLLGPGDPLPSGAVDLRALLGYLRERAWTGAFAWAWRVEIGAALLVEGRIAAAAVERDGVALERNDALRAMYRHGLEPDRSPLRLHPLDLHTARALAGLALGRRVAEAELAGFAGAAADEGGFSFLQGGSTYLRVAAELVGPGGRFLPADRVPDLHLPDDPPGWERSRYALTLRGRDALNPMTELSMRFEQDFGASGRELLRELGGGAPLEDAARRLGLELDELKPWLERLEREGMVRPEHAPRGP